jgi:hypothetical protein
MTHELGKLPEPEPKPAAWRYREAGKDGPWRLIDEPWEDELRNPHWEHERLFSEHDIAAQVAAAVAAERERLRGYFREALADKSLCWPGEVDILYDRCFAAPYVADEDA